MIKVKNSDIEIQNLFNAQAEIDSYGRVIVTMADGFEMWKKDDYIIDDEYVEPLLEDKVYYTYLSFPPDYDFSLLYEKGVNSETVTDKEKAMAYDILMGVKG